MNEEIGNMYPISSFKSSGYTPQKQPTKKPSQTKHIPTHRPLQPALSIKTQPQDHVPKM